MLKFTIETCEKPNKTNSYLGLERRFSKDTFFVSPDFYLWYHVNDDLCEIGLYDKNRIAEVREFVHKNPKGYKLVDDTVNCALTDEATEQNTRYREGLYLYASADLVLISLTDPEYVMEVLEAPIYGPEEENLLLSYIASDMKISAGDNNLCKALSEMNDSYPDIVLGSKNDSFCGLYYSNEFIVPSRMVNVSIVSSDEPEIKCFVN